MRTPLAALWRRLHDVRIGTQLGSAFGLLLLLTAAIGAMSYVALQRVDRAAGTLAEVWLPGVGELTAARADMLLVREFEVKHAHAADDSYRSEYEEKLNAALAGVRRHLDAFRARAGAAADPKLLEATEKRWTEYLAVNAKIIQLSRTGHAEDAREIGDGAGKSTMDDALEALERLTEFAFAQGRAAGGHSHDVYRGASWLNSVAVLLALALGCGLAWAITRSTTRPIREAVRVARSVAAGDLAVAVGSSGSNETGQLLAALAAMQAVLREREAEAINAKGQIAAIHKAQAVVEFELDGTIRAANENFLRVTGYGLAEIQGQPHAQFVDPATRESAEYRALWETLRRGEHVAGTFRRLARGGREVWLEASYNPIFGPDGRPYKVVKYASEVTEQVRMKEALDAAVRETQAIVQSAMDGELTARIATTGRSGQIEALAVSVNRLLDTMMAVVAEIKHAATEVQSGAEEISKGNLNLSQRTEEQASSLEETASSMEQMTSTVKATADNAAQARELALAARTQA
ncbi:MAG: MCP four helix bundle domain-containing protein, partial [Proteobacteria bacterium]|nr:MCP four helix bundle domain-containing protein [Pseudomonadota bacterium]